MGGRQGAVSGFCHITRDYVDGYIRNRHIPDAEKTVSVRVCLSSCAAPTAAALIGGRLIERRIGTAQVEPGFFSATAALTLVIAALLSMTAVIVFRPAWPEQ